MCTRMFVFTQTEPHLNFPHWSPMPPIFQYANILSCSVSDNIIFLHRIWTLSRPDQPCICTWIGIFTLITIFTRICKTYLAICTHLTTYVLTQVYVFLQDVISNTLSPVVATDWGPGYPCHRNSLTPWSTICTWLGIFNLITIFTLICKTCTSQYAHMIRNTQDTNEGKSEAVTRCVVFMMYLSGRGAKCHP